MQSFRGRLSLFQEGNLADAAALRVLHARPPAQRPSTSTTTSSTPFSVHSDSNSVPQAGRGAPDSRHLRKQRTPRVLCREEDRMFDDLKTGDCSAEFCSVLQRRDCSLNMEHRLSTRDTTRRQVHLHTEKDTSIMQVYMQAMLCTNENFESLK